MFTSSVTVMFGLDCSGSWLRAILEGLFKLDIVQGTYKSFRECVRLVVTTPMP